MKDLVFGGKAVKAGAVMNVAGDSPAVSYLLGRKLAEAVADKKAAAPDDMDFIPPDDNNNAGDSPADFGAENER